MLVCNFAVDFVPASIDQELPAALHLSEGKNAEIVYPNKAEGCQAKTYTTYSGFKKQAQKEIILIVDNEKGVITLEKVNSTMTMKKQRFETNYV